MASDCFYGQSGRRAGRGENLVKAISHMRYEKVSALFDNDFSFVDCVSNVCKNSFKLHDLRHIRQYLTVDSALLAANARVSSRLAYSNSCLQS